MNEGRGVSKPRSRWLEWRPKTSIFSDPPSMEPTKPTKPGFDGFVGSTLSASQNIPPDLDGHVVARVRWATNAMIVFNDGEGATWRYLHAFKKSWPVTVSRETGLEKMRQAWQRISDLWDEIESSGGSVAWEWILRGSPHGAKIRAAEDRVNAVGSQGDLAALAAACDGLVNAWREGIEDWKKGNGRTRAEQRSLDMGK